MTTVGLLRLQNVWTDLRIVAPFHRWIGWKIAVQCLLQSLIDLMIVDLYLLQCWTDPMIVDLQRWTDLMTDVVRPLLQEVTGLVDLYLLMSDDHPLRPLEPCLLSVQSGTRTIVVLQYLWLETDRLLPMTIDAPQHHRLFRTGQQGLKTVGNLS